MRPRVHVVAEAGRRRSLVATTEGDADLRILGTDVLEVWRIAVDNSWRVLVEGACHVDLLLSDSEADFDQTRVEEADSVELDLRSSRKRAKCRLAAVDRVRWPDDLADVQAIDIR